MAKRFTDTGIWDRAWFHDLSPRLKEAWRYLCEKCDHAGVWEINLKMISFAVGEQISKDELASLPVDMISDEKLSVRGFIDFQYGCSADQLNPDNRVHRSIITRLERLKKEAPYKPLTSPLNGAKDKDKDKDKEQEKDKEKEKEQDSGKKIDQQAPLSDLVNICKETWAQTLKHFGIDRPLTLYDESTIARAVIKFGGETVDRALYGARFEPKTDKFNPKDYLGLSRIFSPDKFGNYKIDKFVNLAASRSDNPSNEPFDYEKERERLRALSENALECDEEAV